MTLPFATTRRQALMGLAGLLGMIPSSAAAQSIKANPDAELIALGQQFDDTATRIDFAIANTGPGQSYYQTMMEQAFAAYETLHPQIMTLKATTIAGFQVKARVAQWSSADKMSPDDGAIFADAMALSLVGDVLNLPQDHDRDPS